MSRYILKLMNNFLYEKNLMKKFNFVKSSSSIYRSMSERYSDSPPKKPLTLNMASPKQEVILNNKDIYNNFDLIFKSLVDDLIIGERIALPDAQSWFKKVIEYNVPHGKRNRGISLVESYLHLRGAHELTDLSELEVRRALVLGWCIEFLQAFFLVADDIMDQSITRRGRPCWYTQKDVGLVALNDALYLDACVYRLLRKHLAGTPYYVDVVDLFHDVTFKTITGQCLDLMVEGREDGWMEGITKEKYHHIVDYKTGYYSFYLPVACALYMAGIKDISTHKEAEQILIKMARYFQIQDDYLDCYGDPSITGKVGTDIEDNKCSWLLVEAVNRATAEQRSLLKKHYGKKDTESVEAVKKVYAGMGLEEVFKQFEEDSYLEILSFIDATQSNLPKIIFLDFAEKIYKRTK